MTELWVETVGPAVATWQIISIMIKNEQITSVTF